MKGDVALKAQDNLVKHNVPGTRKIKSVVHFWGDNSFTGFSDSPLTAVNRSKFCPYLLMAASLWLSAGRLPSDGCHVG